MQIVTGCLCTCKLYVLKTGVKMMGKFKELFFLVLTEFIELM
jgi:hypothetical protein